MQSDRPRGPLLDLLMRMRLSAGITGLEVIAYACHRTDEEGAPPYTWQDVSLSR